MSFLSRSSTDSSFGLSLPSISRVGTPSRAYSPSPTVADTASVYSFPSDSDHYSHYSSSDSPVDLANARQLVRIPSRASTARTWSIRSTQEDREAQLVRRGHAGQRAVQLVEHLPHSAQIERVESNESSGERSAHYPAHSHSALPSPNYFDEFLMLNPDEAHHVIDPTGLIRSYTALYHKIGSALETLQSAQADRRAPLARARSFSWRRRQSTTPPEAIFEKYTALDLAALTDPETNPEFKPTEAEVVQLEKALEKLEAALPPRRGSAQLLTPPPVVSRRKSAGELWRSRTTAAELGEGGEAHGRMSQRMMARYGM